MAQVKLFDPSHHQYTIDQFANVHIACIEIDRMVANFLPPLSHDKVSGWWKEQASQVAAGTRHIIFAEEQGDVTGVVMLKKNMTETGWFRGEVEKLIVSPNHRQKGIAKMMMRKLEEVAKQEGRTLILLDTETGSPADSVYPKWGYKQYGHLPKYEHSLTKGVLIDGTFYYKDLSLAEADAI